MKKTLLLPLLAALVALSALAGTAAVHPTTCCNGRIWW